MLRQEFLNRLSALLGELPANERDKVIAYYSELIADKVEAGEDEIQVIANFGDINKLASDIWEDSSPLKKVKTAAKGNPLLIALLIVFSPVILGLGMGAFGLLIGLVAGLFGIIVGFFAAAFGFILGGIFAFFGSFIVITTISPVVGIGYMGAGILCTGIGIFVLVGTYYLSKSACILVKTIVSAIKRAFSNKRKVSYAVN